MLDFSTCHVVSFISSLIVGACTFLLSASIYSRYRKNKTKVRLFILFVVFLLAVAIILDPIVFYYSRVVANTIPEGDYIINIQSALSFSFVSTANIFLAFFVNAVFFGRKTVFVAYLFMGVEILISILLTATAFLGLENEDIYIVMFLIAMLLYASQLVLAIRLSRRLSRENQPKVNIVAIRSIGWSGMLLLLALFFFLLQEFAGELGVADALGCSFFIPLAWIAAGLSAFAYYLGYFMPDWLKKRYAS